MARSEKEIWNKMEEMVASKSIYRFEPIDDEDDFEAFEGIPEKLDNEMGVRITKNNGEVKENEIVWIDTREFCFMSIKKIKA